jgi:hypothetical protein
MAGSDREHIISILSRAFEENPRLLSMIKRDHPDRRLRIMAEYAYYIMHKFEGVYLSEDRSPVLMYYRKKDYKRSMKDKLYYGFTFLRAVRITALIPAIKREAFLKELRKPYEDYIYVWALAREPGSKGLRGLADIRDHLFGLSFNLHLPILIETTVEKMLGFYRYVGFEEYHRWHDTKDGIDVWFLERKVKS